MTNVQVKIKAFSSISSYLKKIKRPMHVFPFRLKKIISSNPDFFPSVNVIFANMFCHFRSSWHSFLHVWSFVCCVCDSQRAWKCFLLGFYETCRQAVFSFYSVIDRTPGISVLWGQSASCVTMGERIPHHKLSCRDFWMGPWAFIYI